MAIIYTGKFEMTVMLGEGAGGVAERFAEQLRVGWPRADGESNMSVTKRLNPSITSISSCP